MDLIMRILNWHKNSGVIRDFAFLGWVADQILEENVDLYTENLELMQWARQY